MTIGFIGAGTMGMPIALHLLRAGYSVDVIIRNDDGADVVAAGGRVFTSPSDLDRPVFLFLCLPNAETVEQVLFGPHAVQLAAGAVVIDLTTHDRASAKRIAERLAESSVDFIDAPISGMQQRAQQGTLTVMCGGGPDKFRQVKPLFDCFATSVLWMGDVGSGQTAKLINQLLFDVNMAALAELLPAAVRLGLDPVLVAEVVNGGTGRSYASEFFLPRILQGQFSNGYPLAKAYKDLKAGAALSADLALPMPVLAAATATYQTALAQGHGDLDKGSMILPFEGLSGVVFRARHRLFCTLALRGVVEEIWDDASGPGEIIFEPTVLLLQRIAAGDLPTLALLTDEAAQGLELDGKILSRHPLVLSRIGIAATQDNPPPAFATTDDLVRYLREVPSLCYSKSGASGIHFSAVLERLGIAAEIDAKAVVIPQGLTGRMVAEGKAACAIQQISELAQIQGLSAASPLPEETQRTEIFSAALHANSPTTDALLARLLHADTRPLLAAHGLMPIERNTAV